MAKYFKESLSIAVVHDANTNYEINIKSKFLSDSISPLAILVFDFIISKALTDLAVKCTDRRFFTNMPHTIRFGIISYLNSIAFPAKQLTVLGFKEKILKFISISKPRRAILEEITER